MLGKSHDIPVPGPMFNTKFGAPSAGDFYTIPGDNGLQAHSHWLDQVLTTKLCCNRVAMPRKRDWGTRVFLITYSSKGL